MNVPLYTPLEFNPAAIIGYSRRSLCLNSVNKRCKINLTPISTSSDKFSGTIQSPDHTSVSQIVSLFSASLPDHSGVSKLPPGIVVVRSWTYDQVLRAVSILVKNGEVLEDALFTEQARVVDSVPAKYARAYREFFEEANGFLTRVVSLPRSCSYLGFEPAKSVLIPRTAQAITSQGGFRIAVFPDPFSERYVIISTNYIVSHENSDRGRDWRKIRDLAHEYYEELGRRVEFITLKFTE
jgi:hypothetical protein